MASTVVTVVKYVLPIVLDALLNEARKLNTEEAAARLLRSGDTDQDKMEEIAEQCSEYITSKYYDQFGYDYAGRRSKVPAGKQVKAFNEEIIMYSASGHGLNDINKHLQDVFKDEISTADYHELSSNISDLFHERFQEESLSWTPFVKTFNFDDGLTVDVYWLAATTRNINNELSGIVRYVTVAYQ
ncbi:MULTISPECIES: hypothetical protein [Paenibacillus]|uniref:hypothetical protein n=1 Tax=Paenibacillus TaxID=44249 RepID=UPI0022B94006|nr:hypothetical protein [Paenibacillus caseinilyticus]MCZ8521755.1 hypothetical protein [Paenibacillus caseinilyticus]